MSTDDYATITWPLDRHGSPLPKHGSMTCRRQRKPSGLTSGFLLTERGRRLGLYAVADEEPEDYDDIEGYEDAIILTTLTRIV